MAVNRSSYWAFVVYPESLSAGWRGVIEDWHVPALVSPLHDKDVAAGGVLKKPHFHVMLCYHSLKSMPQVLDIAGGLGVTHVEEVRDARAYARYLCHLDSPDKHVYSTHDVLCISGADYESLALSLTVSDSVAVAKDVINFCEDGNLTEYYDLVRYALGSGRPGWAQYVTGHTLFLTAFLRSKRAVAVYQGTAREVELPEN